MEAAKNADSRDIDVDDDKEYCNCNCGKKGCHASDVTGATEKHDNGDIATKADFHALRDVMQNLINGLENRLSVLVLSTRHQLPSRTPLPDASPVLQPQPPFPTRPRAQPGIGAMKDGKNTDKPLIPLRLSTIESDVLSLGRVYDDEDYSGIQSLRSMYEGVHHAEQAYLRVEGGILATTEGRYRAESHG